jgi:hypothetical protein
MSLSNSDTAFQYNLLPDGIHELILLAPTKAALDECFARLEQIFASTPPGEPVLLLSDTRQSGIPPLGLLISFSRRLFHRYPNHRVIFDALLHQQEGQLFRAFSAVVQRLAGLYRARVQFFHADERQQAIDWLLEQRRQP